MMIYVKELKNKNQKNIYVIKKSALINHKGFSSKNTEIDKDRILKI